MSEEEIIGYTEALEYYENLLSDEEKAKVPAEFVAKMKKYADEKYMGRVTEIMDINAPNISKDGAIKIAYMETFTL